MEANRKFETIGDDRLRSLKRGVVKGMIVERLE